MNPIPFKTLTNSYENVALTEYSSQQELDQDKQLQQFIQNLKDDIEEKDKKIEELEMSLKILQDSLNQLSFDYQKNEVEKKTVEALREEIFKKDEEISFLKNERDLFLWKIKNTSMETSSKDFLTMNLNLENQNDKLEAINEDLKSEIENLKKKLDFYLNMNSEMKIELNNQTEINNLIEEDNKRILNDKNILVKKLEYLEYEIVRLNEIVLLKTNNNGNSIIYPSITEGKFVNPIEKDRPEISKHVRICDRKDRTIKKGVSSKSSNLNSMKKNNESTTRIPSIRYRLQQVNQVKNMITNLQNSDNNESAELNKGINLHKSIQNIRERKGLQDIRSLLEKKLVFPERNSSSSKR